MTGDEYRAMCLRAWWERVTREWDVPLTALVMYEGVDPQQVCRGASRPLPRVLMATFTAEPGGDD